MNSLELNKDLLASVAADSIAKLAASSHKHAKRWINAIAKAVVELENNPFWTFDADSHSLLIRSDSSNEIYTANGTCGCIAFSKGFPCKHRCAARLLMRYMERM